MRLVQAAARATVLTFVATTMAAGQTQNTVPKYTSTGTLTNSAIVEVGGLVGIGTSTPASNKLDVVGDVRFQNSIFTIANGTSDAGRITYNSSNFFIEARGGRHLNFSNGRLVVLDGGNVGIGTATPAAKLHVTGNVQVDGNIAAKYQDVAEWVDASEPVTAGFVVSADADRVNHVRPSSVAYDTAVAGVVSAQPGVLLGEAGEGKVAVAQSGRVRVKVDASSGPIKAGDLLVTSPRAGYAMRSVPVEFGGVQLHRPGTIVGKALEGLAEGTGEVLTLITLQ
jgi:hypothetical protein